MTPEREPGGAVLRHERADGRDREIAVSATRTLTIGRDPSSSLALDSPFVSKSHATIRCDRGKYVLEDLKSANGTRVNGRPITTKTLTNGDEIEVGDQRFVFSDGGAAPSRARPEKAREPARRMPKAQPAEGGGKNTKLAMVAFGTLVVVGGGMFMLLQLAPAPPTPPGPRQPEAKTAVAETSNAPLPPLQPTDAEKAEVERVVQEAQQAGIAPAEGLFDEATVQDRGGRLRAATIFWSAALERDSKNTLAAARVNTARHELERRLKEHSAEADRAVSQLRFDDAIMAWEQILLLADPADPRYAAAESGIRRARRALGH